MGGAGGDGDGEVGEVDSAVALDGDGVEEQEPVGFGGGDDNLV